MRGLVSVLCGTMVTCAAQGAAIRPVMPLQLAFEPAEDGGGFVARADGYGVALSGNGASVWVGNSEVQIQFLHSRMGRLAGSARLPGVVNYLVGKDARHWRRGVPTYAQVRSSGLYPGVDIVFHGGEGRLEYDFIVAPGADVSRIAMRFSGAPGIYIDERGDLIAGDVRQRRPVIYHERDGRREIVAGHYVLTGEGDVAFAIAQYDRGRPLVIDPELVYAQRLGVKNFAQVTGIATDSQGNTYLAMFQLGQTGPAKALVTKLDPTGQNILYTTYVGGSAYEKSAGIAVDRSGQAYLTGYTTSTDFPVTPGALQIATNGGSFVSKLSTDGGSLVYSAVVTDQQTQAGGIAIDAQGSAYITGATMGDLPVTDGAYWTTPPPYSGGFLGPTLFPVDAFVLKLDPTGSHLVYCTYANEASYYVLTLPVVSSIAVDSSGNAYIPGNSILKFNAAGSGLVYSVPANPWGLGYTGKAITLDAHGDVYVAGSTDYLHAFVTKFDPSGKPYFNTGNQTLGGEGNDSAQSIAVDSNGNIFVAGNTSSVSFPLRSPVQEAFNPQTGFLAELDHSGNLLFSTYVGDTDTFQVNGLALDATGEPVFCGNTDSTAYVAKYDTSGIPEVRLDALLTLASQLAVQVSPGEVVAIEGAGFGTDAQLYFDNHPATMIPPMAGLDALMAIVPYALTNKTHTLAYVESGGQRSNPVEIQVVAAAPGIFTTNGKGTGEALAINQDGTPNSQAHPAAAGTTVTFFATGVGQTVPAGVDGVLHRSKPAPTVLPFSVYIVYDYIPGFQFSVGPANGFPADVLQVTAKVPAGIGQPFQASLAIQENSTYTQNTVTIWVGP